MEKRRESQDVLTKAYCVLYHVGKMVEDLLGFELAQAKKEKKEEWLTLREFCNKYPGFKHKFVDNCFTRFSKSHFFKLKKVGTQKKRLVQPEQFIEWASRKCERSGNRHTKTST